MQPATGRDKRSKHTIQIFVYRRLVHVEGQISTRLLRATALPPAIPQIQVKLLLGDQPIQPREFPVPRFLVSSTQPITSEVRTSTTTGLVRSQTPKHPTSCYRYVSIFRIGGKSSEMHLQIALPTVMSGPFGACRTQRSLAISAVDRGTDGTRNKSREILLQQT